MSARRRVGAFLITLLLASSAPAQRGAMVKPLTLEQMSEQADRIVHGHITAAKVEPHPRYRNLTTVVVTFRVQETLKGKAERQFTFRQYLWNLRDKQDGARYRKGGEVLLFLNRVSAEGLTSPVGLDQGRMLVEREHGRAVVRPTSPALTRGLEPALQRRGKAVPPTLRGGNAGAAVKMDLDELKSAVRLLAQSPRSTQ